MNFLLTVNDKFFLPAKLCIESILEFCNSTPLGQIVINDTGLSEANRDRLQGLHPDLRFLCSELEVESYQGLHTKNWLKIVKSKTSALKSCIKQGVFPIVMLDCDQFVLTDVTAILPSDASCVLCKREEPVVRPDGHELNYIGSFFAAMDAGALNFINQWIATMEEMAASSIAPPYETLALCTVAAKPEFSTEIAELSDEIVSSPNKYVPGKTMVYHYKSNTPTEATGNMILDRSGKMFEELPDYFQGFLRDKLDIGDLMPSSIGSMSSKRVEWEPPRFLYENVHSLDQLTVVFGSRKGRLKHNYSKYYEEAFQGLSDTDLSILEVGVGNGSSLKVWSSYFRDADVYGLDLDPACVDLCKSWNNIRIYHGDSRYMSFDREFDVIIDDGSHVSKDIYENFFNLWKFLRPGGLYIIEDFHCVYTWSQSGGRGTRSPFDHGRAIFFNLLDIVFWNMRLQKSEAPVVSCFVGSGFVCIKKSWDENAEFEFRPPTRYGIPEMKYHFWYAARRLYACVRPVRRVILKSRQAFRTRR